MDTTPYALWKQHCAGRVKARRTEPPARPSSPGPGRGGQTEAFVDTEGVMHGHPAPGCPPGRTRGADAYCRPGSPAWLALGKRGHTPASSERVCTSPRPRRCPGWGASHDTPQGPALPLLAALQLIQQRDDHSSPGAAQGVAQGHSTPQRVHLLWGDAQLLHTVDSLEGGRAPAEAPSPVPRAPTGRPRPC